MKFQKTFQLLNHPGSWETQKVDVTEADSVLCVALYEIGLTRSH